jgi:hypothetical protein
MRAIIDQLESELQEVEALDGVTVKAFGWMSDEVPHPNECPAINLSPGSKERDRVFLMGADPEYDAYPIIRAVCWHYGEDLKVAFENCEELAETVQTVVSKISARDTLGIHHFETGIEEYLDYEYEETLMYGAIVAIKATTSETHS